MSNAAIATVPLPPPLAGWTNSPDGRGTIDIIYSSLLTIFLCIWSVLCVNIGPPSQTLASKAYYKFKLAVICALGPDFLMLLAVGQWECARTSVRKFKERGLEGWSMRHAFYADMGGFVVRTRNGVQWPLDTRELLWLIEEGLVVSSEVLVDRSEIDDRNKQDALVRFATIGQIVLFLITFIAREVQHLAVTTLEITTIGFIVTTIGVSVFWFNKPADIETRKTIDVDVTVQEMLARAGLDGTYEWYDTPLDFLQPEKTYPAAAWRYCLHLVLAMSRKRKEQPSPTQPNQRRRDDNFPLLSHRSLLAVFMCGVFSWGSNLVAWNFDFPTLVEKEMWRACSIILSVTVVIGGIYQEILHAKLPDLKKKSCDDFAARKLYIEEPKSGIPKGFSERVRKQCQRVSFRLANVSPNADPSLTMPLRVMLPGLFCGAAYAIARMYLLVEDLVSFRGQNPDIYKTVDWMKFLPTV